MPRQNLPPLASEVKELRALLPAPERRVRPAARERNIQVLCRFRGQSEPEEARGGACVWDLGEGTVASAEATPGGGPQSFGFDRVFGPEARQAEVFAAVEPVVHGVLNGVNGAVLCYGQTSAGKTFTMEGLAGGGEDLSGIIPRSLSAIFDAAEAASREEAGACRLTLSMLEVYMERLKDLLDPESEAELRIVEDRAKGVQVCGLREVPVTNLRAALEVFQCGQRNRCVAATGMNDRSSRSHSVFMLRVEWPGGQKTGAKLYLVDLAGSECLKKACLRGEDAAAANAEIVEEAKAINQSLTTLGLVISRLADRRRSAGEQHVPYRSSKLTRVLQETLGGSSHTVLVVNCAGSSLHAPETLSTLRFGARARSVVNVLNGAPAPEDSLLLQTLRAARLEIQRLRTSGGGACAGAGVADAACGVVAGSWSMVSALTPCSEGPPSPLEVSPSSRRVSRAGFSRPQLEALWERESGRSLSPIDRSLNALSPLQLTPRRSAAASLVPSRRVSRSMPWSRRVSLALTDHDPRDGDLSPLELSPGTSVAVSRRASRGGRRLSRPEPPSEESTPKKDRTPSPGGRCASLQASPMPPVRESLGRGHDPVLRCWEHPMTRQEKFERLLLVREKEVDKLQEQLEGERARHGRKLVQLEEQLAALQTENQWLTADRMQHIEQAIRSSLAGSESPEESPEGEDAERTRMWASCAEEHFDFAGDGAAGAGAGRSELQAELLQEQQRCAELLREHEAALAKERESLAEIKGAHEAALAREQHNLTQLQSMHEAALKKEQDGMEQLKHSHEAALSKERERNEQLHGAYEALAKERERGEQLQGAHEAALAKERERGEQLQKAQEAALAKEREHNEELLKAQEAVLAKERERSEQLQKAQEAALAEEREGREQLQKVQEAALAEEKERREQLQEAQEAALAKERGCSEELLKAQEAALAEEKERREQLQKAQEAALTKERGRSEELQKAQEAALAEERERREQLQKAQEAALAKERERREEVQKAQEAALAKEVERREKLQGAHEELERSARAAQERLAGSEQALAERHERQEVELKEQLSGALASGEALKQELAKVQGELFVAAEARELAAKRAARAEQTLAEENSAASAERDQAREGLKQAKQAEERLSQLSVAKLAERAGELQKAQAGAAKAEEKTKLLEAALAEQREGRVQLQGAHEALDAVHRSLEEQLRSAKDQCSKAVADKAALEASKRRRVMPVLAWLMTLLVAVAAGYAGRAP